MGEALISVLDADGIPTVVERAGILPPRSSMNAVEESVLRRVIEESPIYGRYEREEDSRSAYEVLEEYRQAEEAEAAREAERLAWEKEQKEREKERLAWEKEMMRRTTSTRRTTTTKRRSTSRKTPMEKAIDTAATTVGRELGKKIARGLLGTFLR